MEILLAVLVSSLPILFAAFILSEHCPFENTCCPTGPSRSCFSASAAVQTPRCCVRILKWSEWACAVSANLRAGAFLVEIYCSV